MSSTPPSRKNILISMADAATYVRERYGKDVTRQTVYNWCSKGYHNERLESTIVPAGRFSQQRTTRIWIDTFMVRSGMA
jgi:hypothetical protein